MSWCLWLLQKGEQQAIRQLLLPIVSCPMSRFTAPASMAPKAPCKASRAELTRIRHTAGPPLLAEVVLLSQSSPPETWRCSVTKTPPPGSSRVAAGIQKLPQPTALFVWLGREVTHALFARQRTTRQHPQWSWRRGFVHKTILITKLLGPCFKNTSWRFATCMALYGRVQGQAGSDSEASSSRSGSTHKSSGLQTHRKLTDPRLRQPKKLLSQPLPSEINLKLSPTLPVLQPPFQRATASRTETRPAVMFNVLVPMAPAKRRATSHTAAPASHRILSNV